MHPSRRRKKRPNYGLRTVEVARGLNGFGFTISGQQPCILSCIVVNSPADQAGLRAGDFLISVNGVSVSKVAHDAVVNLIGSSVGPIHMTIAENYYSDSSDEDLNMRINVRKHKPRSRKKHDGFEEALLLPMEEEGGPIEYKTIVGYLGTIEMPKQLLPNSRLQTVCGCIKKLRQEKRKPTAVLMTVLPTCLTLKNASNHILAIYPTNRVVYISSATDKDSRYFGLVTSAVCDRSLETVQKKCETSYTNVWDHEKKCNNADKCEIDVSNSCHVFVTDPKIIDHGVHTRIAEGFRMNCTNDIITGYCLEFPRNALYIVSLVQNMYRLQSTTEAAPEIVANSPQPSASSNSDSGICFRDDHTISDRILVVEFPTTRPNNNRPINIIEPTGLIDVNLNNRVKRNIANIRACESLSIKNAIERGYLAKQNNEEDLTRLHCRAMALSNSSPSPFMSPPLERTGDVDAGIVFTERAVDVVVADVTDDDAFFKVPLKKPLKRTHNLVASCDSLNEKENLMRYKLSPKVYGVAKPNHSCEELNKLDGFTPPVEKCGGSLQDLTSWFGHAAKRKSTACAQSEPDVRKSSSEENAIIKTTPNEPAIWANSFEKLLECPSGLHAFAEFLKKEFSIENIYFWVACERYRRLSSKDERLAEAVRLFRQYMAVGAGESINVDSKARMAVESSLKQAPASLFEIAQKQVFDLMKFDSYSRFLKSPLYQRCVGGRSEWRLDPRLEFAGGSSGPKLKKSFSNAEDKGRKPLLPSWARKSRSKSKERESEKCDVNKNLRRNDDAKEAKYAKDDPEDFSGSKTSLLSMDLVFQGNKKDRYPMCKVRLPNGTTTIQIRSDETIQEFISKLLLRRAINYSLFEVCEVNSKSTIDLKSSCQVLANKEVMVEQKVKFDLSIPNGKQIAVKSRRSKSLVDVVVSILKKYGIPYESVIVYVGGAPVPDMTVSVYHFDGIHLDVRDIEASKPTQIDEQNTLEEITNTVFKDIQQEKTDIKTEVKRDDQTSVKSEDWSSEHSSLIGRFMKRDSERRKDRKKKAPAVPLLKPKIPANSVEDVSSLCKAPIIAKLKPGVHVQTRSEGDEFMYELSRVQCSRLEDQRGTEINFELPDFLKGDKNETVVSQVETRIPNQETRNEPPPLPPKPKVIPAKPSNWQQHNNGLRKEPLVTSVASVSAKQMYLEQPTSSFV